MTPNGVDDSIAVLNAGGWGTALAVILARSGRVVSLWARRQELAEELQRTRENRVYLPGIALPSDVVVDSDLARCVSGRAVVVVAAISRYLRPLAQELRPLLTAEQLVVHGSKGFEAETLLRGSAVLESELGQHFAGRTAALSGPTHAEEVARGAPAAAVLACSDAEVAGRLQRALACPTFRLYTNADLIGVEVCGALKNVIALAAGASDGLGYGDNAKAALITRGLAEMARLVGALGGRASTVSGLAGLGDIIATCTSQHSRNRRAGEQLARGRSLEQILEGTRMVVEGVPATGAAVALAARAQVEVPICEQVNAVLFAGRHPAEALAALMSRELTTE